MVAGQRGRRLEGKRADYLLSHTRDFRIAVVEAKADGLPAGTGLQQAKEYAQILDLKFAYSTNGQGIIEFDFLTGLESELDAFPTPDRLWDRLELAVFGIVYNAVRLVMIHSADAHRVPPDRISFIDVLRWLALGCPGQGLPPFIINPVRSRSPAPRIVRRRHKGHTYMTRPRKPQTKLLVNKELSPN